MNDTSTPTPFYPRTPDDHLELRAHQRFPNVYGVLTNENGRRNTILEHARRLVREGASIDDALDAADEEHRRAHVVVNGWYVRHFGRTVPSDFTLLAQRAIRAYFADVGDWCLTPEDVTLHPAASPAHDRWVMVCKHDGAPLQDRAKATVTLADLLKFRVRKSEKALGRSRAVATGA